MRWRACKDATGDGHLQIGHPRGRVYGNRHRALLRKTAAEWARFGCRGDLPRQHLLTDLEHNRTRQSRTRASTRCDERQRHRAASWGGQIFIAPKMWRIRWPDGSTSDMVNLSRAKDAAAIIAERGPPERNRRLFHWKIEPVENGRGASPDAIKHRAGHRTATRPGNRSQRRKAA
jgi:hypothetical protein